MADIAVATNTAVVAAVPAASSGTAGDASQGQSANPFAQVLQQQIANPAAADVATQKLAVLVTTTDASTPGDIAAFLPMLMGSATFAGTAPMETTANGTSRSAGKDDQTPSADLMSLLAAPSTPVAPAVDKDSDETTTNAVPLVTALAAPVTSPTMVSTSAVPPTPTGGSAVASQPVAAANLAAKPELVATMNAPAAQTSGPQDLLPRIDSQEARAAALAAAAAVPATPPQVATSNSHQAVINAPVGAHGWDTEVGHQLVWMAGNQSSRAELVLTPPQLGRIEVSLTMNGDQATLSFVSANPAVREAIENAVPRLREVLADVGVTLGQTQVGSDSPQQPANGNENRDNQSKNPATATSTSGSPVSMSASGTWTTRARGLVDVFA